MLAQELERTKEVLLQLLGEREETIEELQDSLKETKVRVRRILFGHIQCAGSLHEAEYGPIDINLLQRCTTDQSTSCLSCRVMSCPNTCMPFYYQAVFHSQYEAVVSDLLLAKKKQQLDDHQTPEELATPEVHETAEA
jgi:hypothetical protein